MDCSASGGNDERMPRARDPDGCDGSIENMKEVCFQSFSVGKAMPGSHAILQERDDYCYPALTESRCNGKSGYSDTPHIRTILSPPPVPVTIIVPSGLKAALSTLPGWDRAASSSPLSTSHILTV